MPKPFTQSIPATPAPGNNATVEYCQAVCNLVGKNLQAVEQMLMAEEDAKDQDTTTLQKKRNDEYSEKKDEHELYRKWFLSVAAEMIHNKNHPGFVNVPGDDVVGGACRIPCCMDCGTALQPGYKDTTIRVKSLPKKSRIRQPKKTNSNSKNSNRSSKMMRPQLATWKSTVTTISSSKNNPSAIGDACGPKNGGANKQQDHNLSLSRNACRKECRNELVLICGTCHAKTIYPGMPRRSATTAAAADKKGGGSRSNRGAERGSTTGAKSSKIMALAETTQKELDDNLDFVPLTAPANTAAAANFNNAGFGKKRKGNAQPSSVLLPLQNPKKKKKKKSSQLMDFLSSLNN